jgi:hypothetical protein
MAVGKIYKVKSATFASTAIPGCVSSSENYVASRQTTRADGAIGITKVYTEGHHLEVTITLESNEKHALFKIGDAGSLVIVAFEQEVGVGAVSAADITITYPGATSSAGKAVVTAVGHGYPLNGNPTSTVTFTVYDDAGDRTKLRSVA